MEGLTKSTTAPKTTNLYELADQMDPTQNLAEIWAEEYIEGQKKFKNLVEQWADEAEQQANYLPEQWAEEFSSLSFHEQATENKERAKYVTNLILTFFVSVGWMRNSDASLTCYNCQHFCDQKINSGNIFKNSSNYCRDKSEMWATEFLDEFDQKSQIDKEFTSETAVKFCKVY